MQGSERSCKGPDSVDRGYHQPLDPRSSRHGHSTRLAPRWPFLRHPQPRTAAATPDAPATRPRRAGAASPSPNWPPSTRSAASSSTSNSGRPTTSSTTPLTLAATNPTNSSSGSRLTKPWLPANSILGLTLIGHAVPWRRRHRTARGWSLTIRCRSAPFYNILPPRPSPLHRSVTARQDLAAVRLTAPTTRSSRPGRPVLVGADVASTYCYLLSSESTATPILGAYACWN